MSRNHIFTPDPMLGYAVAAIRLRTVSRNVDLCVFWTAEWGRISMEGSELTPISLKEKCDQMRSALTAGHTYGGEAENLKSNLRAELKAGQDGSMLIFHLVVDRMNDEIAGGKQRSWLKNAKSKISGE